MESLIFIGLCNIVAAIVICGVSLWDTPIKGVTMKRIAKPLTVKQIGQFTMLQGVTMYSKVEDNV